MIEPVEAISLRPMEVCRPAEALITYKLVSNIIYLMIVILRPWTRPAPTSCTRYIP